MLYKLNLNVDKMNDNDGSVTYQMEDGVIYGLTNPEHSLWSFMEEKKPVIVFSCKEIEPGIYESGLNFEHNISMYSDMEAYGLYKSLSKDGKPIEPTDWKELMAGIEPYGVADSIVQIKDYFKEMINSENPVVISVTEMRKEYQESDGGWRWHKWGKYIGTQDPQCEYLHDEPKIESVYVFHIHAVRPQMKKNLDLNENNIETKEENKSTRHKM